LYQIIWLIVVDNPFQLALALHLVIVTKELPTDLLQVDPHLNA